MNTGLRGTPQLKEKQFQGVADLARWFMAQIGKAPCNGLLKRSATLAVSAFLGLTLSTLAFASTSFVEGVESASAVPLVADFERDVVPRLLVPDDERVAYASRLQGALAKAQITLALPQFIVLVDRSPNVQAALLYWGSDERGWGFIGATPVSTGLPGRYEHFLTPLGVFDHSMANPDFRAEGTKNKLGFRGYGVKGMRIYDFGWVESPRGWGDGAMGTLRLQMHSTDPVLAAPRLGTAQSEGCVRIPATLNAFIDRHALLDEDYERAVASGDHLWVLRKDRTPTASPGRYMVVVDTQREVRPDWSPQPAKP
ncbi:L,D-transpeptidase [Polaromonas sp.]|uniref:L,D-transpeptidase n=1 Tax=Polaromonas sp. TaxID=1869339 RepID=UPI0025F75596|nr:L,D-transpeptidase [Polaromonas sp.]